MHVLVDALCVSNPSGRQLLAGHIGYMVESGRHRFTVLHHAGNADLAERLPGAACRCVAVPLMRHWGVRAVCEPVAVRTAARRVGAEAVFTPAGFCVPACRLPQMVFCQNPWALVPEIHVTLGDRLKAALQRRAYRTAVSTAHSLVFNSEYMRAAYAANAGRSPKRAWIVPQGVDEAVFAAASEQRTTVRDRWRVVSVSVMAPHKGADTLVTAVAALRARGLPVMLDLIGAWPDARYRQAVETRIAASGLREVVRLRGHVAPDELHTAYAQARVFSLLSRCESFGFPAVEAQAFGTPTVCSRCCAMPEVQGEGGLHPAVDNPLEAADALERLLTDDMEWARRSQLARANADRFHWRLCSSKLLEVMNAMEADLSSKAGGSVP
jgi:glycosyltransferase involved in cell wall biosynthesis